jgi:Tfp pilus assembly protein PilO
MYLYCYYRLDALKIMVIRSKKMTDDDNKELIQVLKNIEKQLADIKDDLTDIKRELPKVPYYGDLLQDIRNAIENIHW